MKGFFVGITWKVLGRVVWLLSLSALLWLNPSIAKAKKEKAFEVFDGQVYNGKFYPRMDIIEWTEDGHAKSSMEFQVYWKGHQVEMSFELEDANGKKVMMVHYFIPERGEHLCRRVLAPSHFTKDFIVYRDTFDKDMDNTIVTMLPLEEKKGRVVLQGKKYLACMEPADDADRLPAQENPQSQPQSSPIARESVNETNAAPQSDIAVKKSKENVGGGFSKKGVSVPFGDL